MTPTRSPRFDDIFGPEGNNPPGDPKISIQNSTRDGTETGQRPRPDPENRLSPGNLQTSPDNQFHARRDSKKTLVRGGFWTQSARKAG